MKRPDHLISPAAIYSESFRLIDEALKGHSFGPQEYAIMRRVIHATADLDYARTLAFHPLAIQEGLAALKRGTELIVDVRMVETGIRQKELKSLGCQICCLIDDPEVEREADKRGITRSAVAVRRIVKEGHEAPGSIWVIGSSPTALLELLSLVREGAAPPTLIVGVPVGFVLAEAAKEELWRLDHPAWITARGRKGGSSVAVAIVNALLLMAHERES